tara:strand:+ start:707 stop:892 length:186 start_codon:yes stop_codon:yes gene_type:complete
MIKDAGHSEGIMPHTVITPLSVKVKSYYSGKNSLKVFLYALISLGRNGVTNDSFQSGLLKM